MRRTRVFVDSSVLIAAALSEKGAARELIRKGFRGDFVICISANVLEEAERNLAVNAPEALPDFHLLRGLLSAKIVRLSEPTVSAAARIVAAKDAPILAGAVQARALSLATYDRRHLLDHAESISESLAIIVATPDEVLRAER